MHIPRSDFLRGPGGFLLERDSRMDAAPLHVRCMSRNANTLRAIAAGEIEEYEEWMGRVYPELADSTRLTVACVAATSREAVRQHARELGYMQEWNEAHKKRMTEEEYFEIRKELDDMERLQATSSLHATPKDDMTAIAPSAGFRENTDLPAPHPKG